MLTRKRKAGNPIVEARTICAEGRFCHQGRCPSKVSVLNHVLSTGHAGHPSTGSHRLRLFASLERVGSRVLL